MDTCLSGVYTEKSTVRFRAVGFFVDGRVSYFWKSPCVTLRHIDIKGEKYGENLY